MLPVICELMIRPPEPLVFHCWRTRSAEPEVIVPPLSVTVLAATVFVTRRPPLAIVKPVGRVSATVETALKRSELTLVTPPVVAGAPASTSVPEAKPVL